MVFSLWKKVKKDSSNWADVSWLIAEICQFKTQSEAARAPADVWKVSVKSKTELKFV